MVQEEVRLEGHTQEIKKAALPLPTSEAPAP